MRRASSGSTRAGVLAASLAASVAACTAAPEERAANPEPVLGADTAAYYAERVMGALGGREAWNRTRYLSYRWLVERDGAVVADREHSWDRYDGRYRVAFEQADAAHLTLFNLNEMRDVPELGRVPSGRAWIGETELEGAARDSALRRGYTVFVNDSYWALMPFKWSDPGVHLDYEGTRTLSDGRPYHAVRLSFDQGLGVTEDVYWGFVDSDTGRMAAWQYHLGRSEEPGDVIWWTDWEPTGPIQFSMTRVRDGAGRFIYFEDVVAAETVPPGRFDPPGP